MVWLGILAFIAAVIALLVRFAADTINTRDTASFFAVVNGVFGVLAVIIGTVTIVSPGHVGVKVLFGKVHGVIEGRYYSEGFHVVNPFASIEKMSVRTQKLEMGKATGEDDDDSGVGSTTRIVSALAADGVNLDLDVTGLFRLNPKWAPWVYQKFGDNYIDAIVIPSLRAGIRIGSSQFKATDAYSTQREALANRILTASQAELQKVVVRHESMGEEEPIFFENVLVRNVGLPKKMTDAIETKMAAEQEAERMHYVLAREQQEAERKKIEAQGIQDFQAIVSKGITPTLLKWKGIEATQLLAESPNTKIVVIGAGDDGLPLILGGN